jgi:hypothetical protein
MRRGKRLATFALEVERMVDAIAKAVKKLR